MNALLQNRPSTLHLSPNIFLLCKINALLEKIIDIHHHKTNMVIPKKTFQARLMLTSSVYTTDMQNSPVILSSATKFQITVLYAHKIQSIFSFQVILVIYKNMSVSNMSHWFGE